MIKSDGNNDTRSLDIPSNYNDNNNENPKINIDSNVFNSDDTNKNTKIKDDDEKTEVEEDAFEYIDKENIPTSIDDNFIQLLNGNEITITKDNADQCRELGKQLGIQGLVEVADFVDSFSLQYARLSELSEIQETLMKISISNYKELADRFINYINDYDCSTISWIILSVLLCKPLENDSLARFCHILLSNEKVDKEFKVELKKTIQRHYTEKLYHSLDSKNCISNFFFLKKLYDHCKNELFDSNEVKELLQSN